MSGAQCGENEEVPEGVKELLLPALQLPGTPRFAGHAAERVSASKGRKATTTLSDALGKRCDVGACKSKWAHHSLDPELAAPLLARARGEAGHAQVEKKPALLEAQQEKSKPDKLSDQRLEHFLWHKSAWHCFTQRRPHRRPRPQLAAQLAACHFEKMLGKAPRSFWA